MIQYWCLKMTGKEKQSDDTRLREMMTYFCKGNNMDWIGP